MSLRRLAAEYARVQALFKGHDRIHIVEAIGDPPDRYVIEYRLRGLVEEKGKIAERDEHRVRIELDPDYPHKAAHLVMLTPVFHPNINELAICTRDVRAVEEQLWETIVLIGRLITYQLYNPESPRNGDAARWARENAHRFPLENVDLVPRMAMQTSATLPLTVMPASQLLEETAQAPVGSVAVKILETCVICGRSSLASLLERCRGDHCVCIECRLACTGCGGVLCRRCDPPICAECDGQLCGDCAVHCDGCRRQVCAGHIIRCEVCATGRCRQCHASCAECGRGQCRAHLDETGRCGQCVTRAVDVQSPMVEPAAPVQSLMTPGDPEVTSHEPDSTAVTPPRDERAGGVVDPRVVTPEAEAQPAAAEPETTDPRGHATARVVITTEDVRSVPTWALASAPHALAVAPTQAPRTSGKAIGALVLGVVGIPVIGILLGWFAVLCGAMALREIRRTKDLRGEQLARWGIVLGVFSIVAWVALLVVWTSTSAPTSRVLEIGTSRYRLSTQAQTYLSFVKQSTYPKTASVLIIEEPHYNLEGHINLLKGLEIFFRDNPDLAERTVFLAEGVPAGRRITVDALREVAADPPDDLVRDVLGTFLIPGYVAYEWKHRRGIPIVGVEDDELYRLSARLWTQLREHPDRQATAQLWRATVAARNKRISETLVELTPLYENPLLFVGSLHLDQQDAEEFLRTKDQAANALMPADRRAFDRADPSGIHDYLRRNKIGYTLLTPVRQRELPDDLTRYEKLFRAQETGDYSGYIDWVLSTRGSRGDARRPDA